MTEIKPGPLQPSPNIVFFGETGVGKSSIINMLLGRDAAEISSRATGCTSASQSYSYTTPSGHTLTLWDTAGMNEGEEGTLGDTDALAALYRLLKQFKDGVSLLVFCMRGPRISNAAHKNWLLFWEIICRKQVPIVMAVTHLEQQDSLDGWWTENEKSFREQGMNPKPLNTQSSGVACIVAHKGKQKNGAYVLQEEYDHSRIKIRNLVVNNYLARPWKVEPVEWFKTIVTSPCWWPWWPLRRTTTVSGSGVYNLVNKWELSEAEASKLAKILEGIRK